MYLLPGIVGFGAFCLFDINKIRWRSRMLNFLFVIGCVLLAASTLLCMPSLSGESFAPHVRHLVGLAGLLLSAAGLIYVLFFALPFESTYTESDALPLVSHGAYGLCRHPGFWLFALFYFFLWVTFTGHRLFIGFLLYSACNYGYIYLQDRYIFPKYILGYDDYKKTVPFLLPTRESIKCAFSAKGI